MFYTCVRNKYFVFCEKVVADMSPKSKAKAVVEKVRLTPRRRQTVQRKLLLANVVMSEVKNVKFSISKKKRSVLHSTVADP